MVVHYNGCLFSLVCIVLVVLINDFLSVCQIDKRLIDSESYKSIAGFPRQQTILSVFAHALMQGLSCNV